MLGSGLSASGRYRENTTVKAIALMATLVICTSASAHHSFAMFDLTRQETISGTVKAFEWGSPHVWVWLVVDDGNGGLTDYGFESSDPTTMVRWGSWNRNSLAVGEKVTVESHPFKNGKPGGSLMKLTFADGRILRGFSASRPPTN